MKCLSFLSQKGGSGKSTLALHCAVAAWQSGTPVTVLDLDPQGSSAAWSQARKKDQPKVLKATASDLPRLLDHAEGLAILDCPPHVVAGTDTIARLTDLIIIPVRPSVLDLAAAGQTVALAKASGKPAAFVLNAVIPRVAEVGQSKKALARYGFPVAPVEIGNRQTYARALASGSSVIEYEPRGKAAEEITALWEWIQAQLGG